MSQEAAVEQPPRAGDADPGDQTAALAASPDEMVSAAWDYKGRLLNQQSLIAMSLIGVFALVIVIALFRFTSQEVVAIAGIFGSWITAVVAFMFVERGAQEVARSATQKSEQVVEAKDQVVERLDGMLESVRVATEEALRSVWVERLRRNDATWERKVAEIQAQLDQLYPLLPKTDAPPAEVDE